MQRRKDQTAWRCAVRRLRWLAAGGLLMATGCTVGPNYRAPQAQVPAGWTGPTTHPTTQASVTIAQPVNVAEWWTTFNEPTLDSLVGRAVEANLDLRLAESRIRQARAARGVVAGGLWPNVNANGQYRRSFNGGGSGSSKATDLFRAGFDAAWELDVFGGVRRSVEAAEAEIQVSIEDRRDVLVTLAAEVALNYVDLRGLQQQIVIARENLAAQQRSADLTHKRFIGGLAGSLDVANADAQVATTQAQIPTLESAAQQTIYSLSVLLAREPAALLQELSARAPIPTTPPEVPVGLPSDLLRRRPDIRRAEAQIQSATARIGVATADLFPKFSLTGSVGLESSKLASLGNWDSRFWSFGPSATWNIFSAGSIKSNIEVQNALQEQAMLTYQQTVLTALQDVESALVAYAKEQEHRRALTDAVAANRKAVDLATQLYTQGQTDFLNVLSAQRSLFASQDALVQSDQTVATNLVALYKALGGGWEIEAGSPATAPTTRPAVAAAPATRSAGEQ